MNQYKQGLAVAAAAGMALYSGQAAAEFYLGASIGEASIEAKDDLDGEPFKVDDSDTAYKIFGGYMFNDYIGVELGYVDMGTVSERFSFDGGEFSGPIDAAITADITGFTAHVVGQVPVGPVDLFAKAGLISYEAKGRATVSYFSTTESERFKDTGEDFAYGVGAKWNLGNFAIRAEYEMFDISDVDDLDMISIGVQFTF